MKLKKTYKRFNLLSVGLMVFLICGSAATKMAWDQLNTAGSFTDGYVPKIVAGVVTWSPDAAGGLSDGTYNHVTVSSSGTNMVVNSSFTGTTGITTLGTIATGTWNGTAIGATYLPGTAADGSTKGIAAFTANDFNEASDVVSIDYTNGQAATGSLKGFLTSTDWTLFNGKLDPSKMTYEVVSGTIDGSNTSFTVTAAPATSFFILFKNGQALVSGSGNDFTRSGANITMLSAPSTGVLTAMYIAP